MIRKVRLESEKLFLVLGSLFIVAFLSGCVVRTYPLTRDRVDQELDSGNRGYLKGSSSSGESAERKTTRTTRVVEIELRSPIKFEKMPKESLQQQSERQEPAQKEELEGNKGYITRSVTPEIAETESAGFEKYTVQKNDTLQKISQKFYGTTKNWLKIYEANKDVLKGPNKVYPGQVIKIPASGIKSGEGSLNERKGNWK